MQDHSMQADTRWYKRVMHLPEFAAVVTLGTSIPLFSKNYTTFFLELKNPNQKPLKTTPKPYTLYPKPEILF
jgi:hypothetical protein